MEELASAKRSHNAHKGIFGQRIKTFESRVASFKRSPEVPQNWAEVEDAFEKVKLSYDRLQNAYTEVIIMEHDPGLETQNQAYYTSMEECSNEFLKAAEAKDKDKVLETGDRDDMKRRGNWMTGRGSWKNNPWVELKEVLHRRGLPSLKFPSSLSCWQAQ